jgi:regulator of protease activity HflC (stomatin/prohibitin superfamily)
MWLFVLGFVAIACGLVSVLLPYKEGKAVAALCIIGAAVFFFFSFFAIVGTKKIGVVTSFNKPVGTMDNGLHTKAPWQKVVELDGAIQTDNHLCRKDANTGIDVRIGNQSISCLDVTIRWRLRQGASDALYRDYRTFDHIRDSLVTRDLIQSLNDVFVDYNPLGNINNEKVAAPPSLERMSSRVKALLVGRTGNSGRIGDQIEVLSVFIPIVHHDGQTQQKINQYQAARADTRIAGQKVQTATNEAKANKVLAGTVTKNPYVLVSKCLDLVKGRTTPLPAGFNCWPGGSSAVVVPQTGR